MAGRWMRKRTTMTNIAKALTEQGIELDLIHKPNFILK